LESKSLQVNSNVQELEQENARMGAKEAAMHLEDVALRKGASGPLMQQIRQKLGKKRGIARESC